MGLGVFYLICGVGAVANVGVASFAFTSHYTWWPERSSALSGTLRCPPFSLGVEVKDRDSGRRRRAPANEPRPIYSRYRRRGNARYIMEPRVNWRAPDQCGIELS